MCTLEGENCNQWGVGYQAGQEGMLKAIATAELLTKEKIYDIIKVLPFIWMGDKQNLEISKDQLLDMIEKA